MDLKKQIQEDLKDAMRQSNTVAVGTLRMVLASVINKEKEEGKELSDEQIQTVLSGEAKKRKEAAEAFSQADKKDMADQEQEELEVIQKYLPEQMAEDEVRKLVRDAITTTGATGVAEIGKVMAVLMPQVKGKADGSLVNSIVKELLA